MGACMKGMKHLREIEKVVRKESSPTCSLSLLYITSYQATRLRLSHEEMVLTISGNPADPQRDVGDGVEAESYCETNDDSIIALNSVVGKSSITTA